MAEEEKFDAEKFVDLLLSEGAKTPCDDTVSCFNRPDLPPYYNQELYKRGQLFFRKNIFSLLFGKILGLITILSIPTITKILIFTKNSSSGLTAYRRYLSTLLHMCIWYEDDFSTKDTKSWKSINEVKNRHNSASKRACTAFNRINQKDMALTQFGFMGFALVRSKNIGLHNIDGDDWNGFVHIWRVVGYLMGIEERFNICRNDSNETRQICQVLIDRVFSPNIERKDDDFLLMSKYLVEGVWTISPMISYNSLMVFLHELVQPIEKYSCNNNNNNYSKDNVSIYFKLSLKDRFMYYLTIVVMWSLQFFVFRLYFNYVELLAMWLRRNFPFLAYYKFGYANSRVLVLK